MADPFLGEIKMFAGNYAIKNYALCSGQILAVNQYDALYSLLGNTYGGSGGTSFALPDLRGRVAVGMGGGYYQGQHGGYEQVPLTADHVPSHNHAVMASSQDAVTNEPSGNSLAKAPCYSGTAECINMNSGSVSPGSQYHSNIQPSLAINYLISLTGTFPPRY